MKKTLYIFLLAIITACSTQTESGKHNEESDDISENRGNEELLSINASQHGMKYRETFILQQNKCGVRIEYCVDRSNLQLWLSPQAGKSMSYKDRNWSNRDDHTNIFKRILLPGLTMADFDSCTYDPYHSVLHYGEQKLHISQVYDKPVVLLWFEKDGGVIDFKSTGGDKELVRSDKKFVIESNDRRRDFQFAAVIAPGEGKFQHQLQLDDGRSIYARAHLKAGQLIAIAGELAEENIQTAASEAVHRSIKDIMADNEVKINELLKYGNLVLKNQPKTQKLFDIARRHTSTMIDFKGFMRSTNQYIYYLAWYRDGGMNTPPLGYVGETQMLYDHTNFVLQNPNISYEEPKGSFYGQLVSGPITKWEEDGLFYVIWPAFTYWTQTGDKSLCEGKNLQTMETAMKWLEDYIYDDKKGLFGRYHYCETPLTGSRGDGYDNATGSPTWKWISYYKEDTIVRSYDLYINMLNYASYLMLSSMEESEKADEYYNKAMTLENNMKKFFEIEGPLPSYGELINSSGKSIIADAYGMDRTDYQWSINLPLLLPNMPQKLKDAREQFLQDLIDKPKGTFLCSYYAILRAMDNEIHDEDKIMKAMNYPVDQCVKPGIYLPMSNTIVEIVDAPDGHPFHDVRPLVFSSSQWYAAAANLGLRRLAFGIAARATKYVDRIDKYQYMGGVIDITYQGEGKIEKLLLNGKEIKNSYQIPVDKVKKGTNTLEVIMGDKGNQNDILISSTLQLNDLEIDSNVKYSIKAYGKNVLTFKNLSKEISVTDNEGNNVELEKQEMDHLTYFEFSGRGEYTVELK